MGIRFTGSQEAADADSNFPVAPEGTIAYLTVVENGAKERKAKESGRDMLELEMLVSEGEYKEKVRVWHYLTFIEAGAKGHGMTLHALHAFGFEAEGENDFGAAQFVGRTVKVELGVDTYQGKRKNVIKKFLVEEEPPARKPVEDPSTSFNPEELEEAAAGKSAAPPARQAAPPARAAAPAPARKLPWGGKR